MFGSRRTRLLTGALCVALAGAYSAALPRTSDALAPARGTGEVCAVADADGLATIGYDHVFNVSDEDVVARGLDLAVPGLEVLEWSFLPVEWTGGVLRGDQLGPGEGSRRIEAGAERLVVMVVRMDAAAQPPGAAPVLTFEEEEDGTPGTLVLSWRVTMAPHGAVCDLGPP